MSVQTADKEVLYKDAAGCDAADAGSRTTARCLSFKVDELKIFLSTEYVTEIINGYSITHIPMLPAFVKGMINLRGQILPIVDIRLCMGKEQIEYRNETCIVVVSIDGISLGMVVDEVLQVLDIDFSRLQDIPVRRKQKLLNGMVILEDGQVLMSFDHEALLRCR